MKKLLPFLLVSSLLLSSCTTEVKDCKGSLQCLIDSITPFCDPVHVELLSRGTSGNNENLIQIRTVSLGEELGECTLKEEIITSINTDCPQINMDDNLRYKEFGISPEEVVELQNKCYQKNKEQRDNYSSTCPIKDTNSLKMFYQKSMDQDGLYDFEMAQNEYTPFTAACDQIIIN